MLVVTHEMQFAREVGTRMLFMDGGRVLEDAAPVSVLRATRASAGARVPAPDPRELSGSPAPKWRRNFDVTKPGAGIRRYQRIRPIPVLPAVLDPRRLSPTQRVWGVGVVVVLVTVLCAGLTIWDLHRKTMNESSEEMANLGFVLAEQTSRYVQVVDLLLQETQAHIRDLRIQTPEQLQERLVTDDAHRFLRGRMINLPQANALVLIDSAGRLLNSSREWPIQHVDLSNTDVYTYFRANPDDGLFISPPIKSRITGEWTIYLARRIAAADGTFLGTVAGALDVRYLVEFYRTISMHQNAAVTLLRHDGMVLARYPDTDRFIGTPIPTRSHWYAQVAAGGGSYLSPGLRRGTPSIISVNPLTKYDLVVDVSMRQSDALATWRQQFIFVASGEFVAAVAFIMLFWVVGRQFRRQQQHNAELQRMTETARTSEARLRDYAEMASDWFWEQDTDLRFVSITAGTPMIGPNDKPYAGKRRWEMVDSDPNDERWSAHKADLAARRPFRDFRYERIGNDGRLHHVSVSGNPVFNSEGEFTGYRGTGRDITRDIEAAAALRLSKERAEEAYRTKSEFLANMSHELRTPLNAVIGFAELIRDHPFGSKDARCADYARDIHASGRHLLDLINDVLDMSKIEMGHYKLRTECVDLQEVVRACSAMVAVRAREAQVSIEVADLGGVQLIGDRVALKQIVLNLLANAVKFTLPGGNVRISAAMSDEVLALAISDTGIGVDEASLPQLCDPFYQVDGSMSRTHGGTGLGLAICNKLLKLHDGSLRIVSRRGHGTTVTAIFPKERVAERLEVRRALT